MGWLKDRTQTYRLSIETIISDIHAGDGSYIEERIPLKQGLKREMKMANPFPLSHVSPPRRWAQVIGEKTVNLLFSEEAGK